MDFNNFKVPYEINDAYKKRVAYFSSEFAVHQPLKIYSGGLGFLSGSHMRSAYELKQNLVGIGIFWKFGYYDQTRNSDESLKVEFTEKNASFLQDTGIKFEITIHEHPVWVKALYLAPDVFNTAPMFLLTTDLPENDSMSQSISHRLYDSNQATKIAQFILLGIGGAKLLDILNFNAEVYHLNEAHGISCAFHLYNKFKSLDKVKALIAFTTHTPEEAGNEKHDMHLCHKMSYFNGLSIDEVRTLTGMEGDLFNHSLAALRMCKKANGVSELHGHVSRAMWSAYSNTPEITHITNAQNWRYWADKQLYNAMTLQDDDKFDDRKKYLKRRAFEIVADQTGKIFKDDVLTIVWARRFAGYKRPDLITRNEDRFKALMERTDMPIQIIFAGKPYPMDYGAISDFNNLVYLSKKYKNMAVVTGYELALSKRMKQASDVWLNNPRVPREASGTSGMTAAMNGAVNFSTDDGWIPEFAHPGNNCFVIPKGNYEAMQNFEQDEYDLNMLYDILEHQIIPIYYNNQATWKQITKNGMRDVLVQFNSNRMAEEYYTKMYI